jgi:hypothetical protein
MDRRLPLVLVAVVSVALIVSLVITDAIPLPAIGNPSIPPGGYIPPTPGSNWTHLATVGSPTNSSAGMMTYLPSSGELLLVDPGPGCGPSTTWVFSGGSWVNLSGQVGPGPTPGRGRGGLAYDAADGYAVLFGGASPCGTYNDTWTFENNIWTQLTTTSAPPPLSEFAMTYDATDGYVLLTGGCCIAGANSRETWAFAHGIWTNLTQSPTPVVDSNSAMTFDASLGVVVFVGGYASGFVSQATWTFVGGVWTRVYPAVSPANRAGLGLAYDAAISKVVLVGGYTKVSRSVFVNLTDTWTYELRYGNGYWLNLTAGLTGTPPFVTAPGLMAYDAARQQVVLFAGYDETWTFGQPGSGR